MGKQDCYAVTGMIRSQLALGLGRTDTEAILVHAGNLPQVIDCPVLLDIDDRQYRPTVIVYSSPVPFICEELFSFQ